MPKGVRKKSDNTSRELILKQLDQEYASVTKALGDCRLECKLIDGSTVIGHIRGKLMNKRWIGVGDYVLVTFRDFQKDKVDIVEVYDKDEVRRLQKLDEIPSDKKDDDVAFLPPYDDEE